MSNCLIIQERKVLNAVVGFVPLVLYPERSGENAVFWFFFFFLLFSGIQKGFMDTTRHGWKWGMENIVLFVSMECSLCDLHICFSSVVFPMSLFLFSFRFPICWLELD